VERVWTCQYHVYRCKCARNIFLLWRFLTSPCQVPDKPPQSVEEGRNLIDQNILQNLQTVREHLALQYSRLIPAQLFAERPIWTRMSLFNQMAPAESREILK
jgi:general transcription factor 3C polypeptide 5 (transcription factor C subunit 1)